MEVVDGESGQLMEEGDVIQDKESQKQTDCYEIVGEKLRVDFRVKLKVCFLDF